MVDPYCFECLFSCLSISNIANLLGCLLAEDNILFYSRRLHLLAPALEALQSLIFPFRWTQASRTQRRTLNTPRSLAA